MRGASNYRAPCAGSDKTSARLRSITKHLMHFCVKRRIFGMTICRVRFVFIHIVGSTFIFNIHGSASSFHMLMKRRPSQPALSTTNGSTRLPQRIRDPPRWEAIRKSAIGSLSTIGNRNSTAGWNRPSSASASNLRPSDPDAGILPCGLRKSDALEFAKEVDLRMRMTVPRR